MLGDASADSASIVPYLKDAEPRVRFAAGLALARTLTLAPISGDAAKVESTRAAVLEMLRENEDKDSYIRHAGVAALAELSPHELAIGANDPPAVRMAVVLALRREQNANAGNSLVRFLTDSDSKVVLEAARAIHDLPIVEAMPALASFVVNPKDDPALLFRVLNANFRLGTEKNAVVVAAFAARVRYSGIAPRRSRQNARRVGQTVQSRPDHRRLAAAFAARSENRHRSIAGETREHLRRSGQGTERNHDGRRQTRHRRSRGDASRNGRRRQAITGVAGGSVERIGRIERFAIERNGGYRAENRRPKIAGRSAHADRETA